MHTLEEIIEIIEDTNLEFKVYCNEKECMYETCAIKRNKRKIGKDNEIDCLVLFTLYKLGIDQEDIIKDVYKRYRNYCYTGKSCRNCRLLKFIHDNFDNDDLPYCRSCYAVLHIYNMLDLIGERK